MYILAGEFDDGFGYYFRSTTSDFNVAVNEFYNAIKMIPMAQHNIVDLKIVKDVNEPFELLSGLVSRNADTIAELIEKYGDSVERNTYYITPDVMMCVTVDGKNVNLGVTFNPYADASDAESNEEDACAEAMVDMLENCEVTDDSNANACRWCAVAHMCGVSDAEVTQFLNGETDPSVNEVMQAIEEDNQ